jgi:hypothetical protein
MVGVQNLEITQLIPHAQFVVSLELVSMAGPADTLKVLPAVWITGIQSADEPCRHDVVHMAACSSLLEVYSAGRYFTISAQRRDAVILPTLSRRGCSGPFSVYPLPTHWFLLRTETRLAEMAPAVAIRLVPAIDRSQNIGLFNSAIWTKHRCSPPSRESSA